MRPLVLAHLILAHLLLAVPALAQPPTTQSLIDALRPPESNETRGVLRLPPAATAGQRGMAMSRCDPGLRGCVRPQPADERPQASLQVRFGFDSATLTPEATQVLDNLGRALNSPTLALYRFRLVGHTDAQGTEAYNTALSERRAQAVAAYLRDRWAVDATRLVSEGRGFRELIDDANPLSPANRRVQVINEGPAG